MKIGEHIDNILKPFKGDGWQINFLVSMVWGVMVVTYLDAIFIRLPFLDDIRRYIIPTLYIAVIALCSGHFVKLLSPGDYLFWGFLSLVYFAYYLIGPERNAIYMQEYMPAFFLTVSSYYFIGKAVDDNVFDVLYWLSILTIFLRFISIFITHSFSEEVLSNEDKEFQGQAYELLVFSLFVFWYLLKKFNIVSLLFSVLSIFMLLSFGCRGAILCMISFVILYLLLVKKMIRNVPLLIVCLFACGICVLFADQAITGMSDIMENLGFSTRIFDFYFDGEILSNNGRNQIQTILFDELQEHPFGLGICGAQGAIGTYSHNFILEFIISFGWALGGLICVGVFFVLFKGYNACTNDNQRGFSLVLFCASVVHLFVSGIVWKDSSFYMLLGYCAMLIGRQKDLPESDEN